MYRLDSALFAPLDPYATGMLDVGHGHQIYWEEAGNPEGLPIVILHGGPGGEIRPYYRQLADPGRFRIILFDQRGCGKSLPFGELKHNTTRDLVHDVEQLRKARGIDQWIVLGGSWGSTLAIFYGETFPESCLGIIVTGVFLARQEDDWWWWNGVRYVFPEVWEGLTVGLSDVELSDLRGTYMTRILDPDPAVHMPALVSLMKYEAQTLDVLPDMAFVHDMDKAPNIVAMGRIFAHFMSNDFFLESNELLKKACRLHNIPGAVIAGRYDGCTPPRGAYDLHKVWHRSSLEIIPAAGHRWNDPFLSRVLVARINSMADKLSGPDRRQS